MTVEQFKEQVLRCVIDDAPWDTALVYADADTDLPELSPDERDRAVAGVLTGLLDEGLIYFYEATDFGETYSRTVSESAGLSREEVVAVLSPGTRSGPQLGSKLSPWLVIGATLRARERHARGA